jgi:hypothetical protein
MPYIPDPHVDTERVSYLWYAIWWLGVWMKRKGDHLESLALDRCEMCGMYKHGKPHLDCDGIPF